MRAFVCLKDSKINIEADFFKVEGEMLYVLNSEKIVAIAKIENLVEAHLSEVKKWQ